jgi:hypothetical protein
MYPTSSFRITAIISVLFAASVPAQLPGAPVLQNAWATPGLVAAIDAGGGSGGSSYAVAASWAPGSGRFQLSGGGGVQTLTDAGTRGVYGFRAAIPFGGASSTFGLGAFVGIGGGSATKNRVTFPVPSGVVLADSVQSTTQIPVGASVGWRHSIGATHGVSVYATPSYVYYSGGGKNEGLMRAALGADLGITSAIGATLGIEFGQTRPRGFGGPSSALYGLGLSYAMGRR